MLGDLEDCGFIKREPGRVSFIVPLFGEALRNLAALRIPALLDQLVRVEQEPRP